jgi:hypothetical protein
MNLTNGLNRDVKKIQKPNISVGKGEAAESERSTSGGARSSSSCYHFNDSLANSLANKATASFSKTAY